MLVLWGTLLTTGSRISACLGLNIDELRSLLSLCNLCPWFVPYFAGIGAPLTWQLENGQPLQFRRLSKTEIGALEKLEHQLLSPPIVSLTTPNGRYMLGTDGCEKQVSCFFLQRPADGPAKLVGYWSNSLSMAEQAHNTTHREYFAVVWALVLLRLYLEGLQNTI